MNLCLTPAALLHLLLIGCASLVSCALRVDTTKNDSMTDAGEPAAAAVESLHHSGTRLRARITDAGDGARRFDGWYDTKLKTPCTFQLATDGVQRCVPMADFINNGPDYSDPGCTAPVLPWVDPKQEAPFFTSEANRVSPSTVCTDLPVASIVSAGVLVTSWRIGNGQPAPPALYFRGTGGSCTQRLPDTNITVVYPLEKVAPSDLVAVMTTRLDPRGASLAAEVPENEDGSSMTGNVFDVALKHWCFPSWVDGITDDYRCYGSTFPRGDTEPECKVGAGCENDAFLDGVDFCKPPTFHRLTKTSCDVFDAAQFPMVASDWLGTGRVRLVVTHASDDARPLFVNPNLFETIGRYKRGPFFDTERQMTCDATVLEDGTVRCLTQDVTTADMYADAGCTTLIALNVVQMDPCPTHPSSPAPAFAVSKPPARIYKLGAHVHRDQVYSMNPSTTPPACEMLPSGPLDTFDLTPGDASIFATLKVGIEERWIAHLSFSSG